MLFVVESNVNARACAFNNYCLAKLAFQLLLIILNGCMCVFVIVVDVKKIVCIDIAYLLVFCVWIIYSIHLKTTLKLNWAARQIKSNQIITNWIVIDLNHWVWRALYKHPSTTTFFLFYLLFFSIDKETYRGVKFPLFVAYFW